MSIRLQYFRLSIASWTKASPIILKSRLNRNNLLYQLEIENVSDNVENTLIWFVDSYSAQQKGDEINYTFADAICGNAKKYFNLDNITVYNANGLKVSDSKFGKISDSTHLKTALSGTSTFTLAEKDGVLYSLGAIPLKNGNKVIGAVLANQVISSDEFVASIKKTIDTEFTIFDGYRRAFTTITGMKGTEIADKTIIDRVIDGEEIIQLSLPSLQLELSSQSFTN